jgi:phosphatidate cytidylyltransferase
MRASRAAPRYGFDMNDSLDRRTIAGSAFVLLVIGLAYVGGLAFALFALVVLALGLREFFSLVRAGGYAPFGALGVILGLIIALCAFLFGPGGLAGASAGSLLACMAAPVFKRSERGFADAAVTAVGVFYVAFLGSHMILLRDGPRLVGISHSEGFAVVMSAFAATWCSDTSAYLVGRAVGRHKLMPAVSPGKTWEGAVAGLAGAVGGLALVRWLLDGPVPWPQMLPLGAGLGVVALIGDLVESSLKRSVGWKDTSKIIPGHGGVLDRFDSFLFVAPVLYYYLYALGFGRAG